MDSIVIGIEPGPGSLLLQTGSRRRSETVYLLSTTTITTRRTMIFLLKRGRLSTTIIRILSRRTFL